MCKHFHTAVENASAKFYMEQKRRTYVTPTSYLELIQTFTNLYHLKVESITMQRDRYEAGLDKLDFAASQVGLMQEELHRLQPKLIVASAKTEKLMIKIEQDTVIVEKKKEVLLLWVNWEFYMKREVFSKYFITYLFEYKDYMFREVAPSIFTSICLNFKND